MRERTNLNNAITCLRDMDSKLSDCLELIEMGEDEGDGGIVVESGEPREVHHFALLVGYGAAAVNPYLALDTLAFQDDLGVDAIARQDNFIRAVDKGFLKVM